MLLAHFAEALRQAGGEKIFIGGKSMGGRMATMLATEQPCAGVICFGYPFHPPGKADKTRIDHFANMQTATLICQGDVASYALPDSVQLQWLKDGNHDLAPRRASGLCQQDNIEQAAHAAAKWITAQSL